MKQGTFGLLVFAGVAAVMTPAILLAAGGAGGGFDAVVRGIEGRYHVHANRIPFMGLISGIAGIATHGGVRGLHVAEIEHVDGPVDGAELNALIEQHAGAGWQRIVRDTSRNGEEQSLIFARPDGQHLGMLIVDLDGHEMNIVQVSVNPDQLMEEVSHHRHHDGQGHEAGSPDGDTPQTDSEDR